MMRYEYLLLPVTKVYVTKFCTLFAPEGAGGWFKHSHWFKHVVVLEAGVGTLDVLKQLQLVWVTRLRFKVAL